MPHATVMSHSKMNLFAKAKMVRSARLSTAGAFGNIEFPTFNTESGEYEGEITPGEYDFEDDGSAVVGGGDAVDSGIASDGELDSYLEDLSNNASRGSSYSSGSAPYANRINQTSAATYGRAASGGSFNFGQAAGDFMSSLAKGFLPKQQTQQQQQSLIPASKSRLWLWLAVGGVGILGGVVLIAAVNKGSK